MYRMLLASVVSILIHRTLFTLFTIVSCYGHCVCPTVSISILKRNRICMFYIETSALSLSERSSNIEIVYKNQSHSFYLIIWKMRLLLILPCFLVTLNAQSIKEKIVYGKFPKDFMWGVSSSSYQVEGGWNADGKLKKFNIL